jgi:cytoskeletal protein CcmA (bactofilin family)
MQTMSGLHIKGELTAEEDVTLDGRFEGAIDLPRHRLVATERSHVNASVTAKTVAVNGHLQGHITADIVNIGPTAIVEASVMAERLGLQDGAQFNGAINSERARAAGTVARHRSTQAQP